MKQRIIITLLSILLCAGSITVLPLYVHAQTEDPAPDDGSSGTGDQGDTGDEGDTGDQGDTGDEGDTTGDDGDEGDAANGDSAEGDDGVVDEVNTVTFYRVLPNGTVKQFNKPVSESGMITLGGLGFPLNFLNGAKIEIPEGALSEDISVTIKVPPFAEVDDEAGDVTFDGEDDGDDDDSGAVAKVAEEDEGTGDDSSEGDDADDGDGEADGDENADNEGDVDDDADAPKKIFTGVTFEVAVDGIVVMGDYYFGEPLRVTLPYKQELLANLGIEPTELGMYFANSQGDILGSEGISDVTVDDISGKITGNIIHFSTVVVAGEGDGDGPDAGNADSAGDNDGTGSVDADDAVPSLKIYPRKVNLVAGDTAKFEAWVRDELGEDADVVVSWELSDNTLGSVDGEGLFTAAEGVSGHGSVTATAVVGDITLTDMAQIFVTTEEPALPEGMNRIGIYREMPNGITNQFGSPVTESETVTVGGLPFPLNLFNGMKVKIPDNALEENVEITIKLPEFSRVDEDAEEVDFDEAEDTDDGDGNSGNSAGGKKEIVSGVTFVVTVDGVEVEGDYYFTEPLEVTIPFKRGLIEKLGIDPAELGMYFADGSGGLLGNAGITDVIVDAENNVVTGKVVHFSTVVLAADISYPSSVNEAMPGVFSLGQNVPNPFNPTTTIAFEVPVNAHVKLEIFNILGQKVVTLHDGMLSAGTHSVVWNSTDAFGNAVTSGVYFYRLTANGMSSTRKLMLMK